MTVSPGADPEALVRAVAALAPTDARTLELIAKVLGVTPVAAGVTPARTESPARAVEALTLAELSAREVRATARTLARAEAKAQRRPAPPRVARLYALPSPERSPPFDLYDVPFLAPSASAEQAVIHEPLLPRRTAGGVLKALLAQTVADGSADLPALIRDLAQGRPLRTLPRKKRATLARGAWILVDRGPGLAPFRDDVSALLGSLKGVLARDRLIVRFCEGWPPSPSVEGLPPPGLPVLILSDFGLSPARQHEPVADPSLWAEYARTLNEAGHEVLGLAPSRPEAWTPDLASAIRLTPWEPATTARAARRAREAPARWTDAAGLEPDTAAEAAQTDRLLTLLSAASRIERPLLRSLRRAILPDASPAVEADAWWSDAIGSRGETAITLTSKAARVGRKQLRNDQTHLDLAMDLVRTAHASASPGVRLEEDLIALSTSRWWGWRSQSEALLKSALRTLLDGSEREAGNLARWAVNALPQLRLPRQAADVARDLLYASALKLGRLPLATGALAARSPPAWLINHLQRDQYETVEVGVTWTAAGIGSTPWQDALAGDRLQARASAYTALAIAPENAKARAWAKLGDTVPLGGADSQAVEITDAAGSRWRLEDADRADARPPLRILVVVHPDDMDSDVAAMLDDFEVRVRAQCGLHPAAPVLLRREANGGLAGYDDAFSPGQKTGYWRQSDQPSAERATAALVVAGQAFAQADSNAVRLLLQAAGLYADPTDERWVHSIDWNLPPRRLLSELWKESAPRWRRPEDIMAVADERAAAWRTVPALPESRFNESSRLFGDLAKAFQGLIMPFHIQSFSRSLEEDWSEPDLARWRLSPDDPEGSNGAPRDRRFPVTVTVTDFRHLRSQTEYIFGRELVGYLAIEADPFRPLGSVEQLRRAIESVLAFEKSSTYPSAVESTLEAFQWFAPPALAKLGRPVLAPLSARFASPHDDEAGSDAGPKGAALAMAELLHPFHNEFSRWRVQGAGSLDGCRTFPEYLEGFLGQLNHVLRALARSEPDLRVILRHSLASEAMPFLRSHFSQVFSGKIDTEMPIATYADLVADVGDELIHAVRIAAAMWRERS